MRTQLAIKKSIYIDFSSYQDFTFNEFCNYNSTYDALYKKDEYTEQTIQRDCVESGKYYKISFDIKKEPNTDSFNNGYIRVYLGVQEYFTPSGTLTNNYVSGTIEGSYSGLCYGYSDTLYILFTSNYGITNLQIEEINYTFLDLYDDAGIDINQSYLDIKEMTKKSTYSNTFRIPGTSVNQKHLNFLLNNNLVNITNINKKVKACILVNNNIQYEGYIQFLKIYKTLDKIEYEVIFMSDFFNIYEEMGDKKLNELKFTDAYHKLTESNVVASWNESLLTRKYVYPYIDYGQGWRFGGGCAGNAYDIVDRIWNSEDYGLLDQNTYNLNNQLHLPLNNSYTVSYNTNVTLWESKKNPGLTCSDLFPALSYWYVFQKLMNTYGWNYNIYGIPGNMWYSMILPTANDINKIVRTDDGNLNWNNYAVVFKSKNCGANYTWTPNGSTSTKYFGGILDSHNPNSTDAYSTENDNYGYCWYDQKVVFIKDKSASDGSSKYYQNEYDDDYYDCYQSMAVYLYNSAVTYWNPFRSRQMEHNHPAGTYLVKKAGYYRYNIDFWYLQTQGKDIEVSLIKLKKGTWSYVKDNVNSVYGVSFQNGSGFSSPNIRHIMNERLIVTEEGSSEIFGGTGIFSSGQLHTNKTSFGYYCEPGDLLFISYKIPNCSNNANVEFRLDRLEIRMADYGPGMTIYPERFLDPEYTQQNFLADFINMFNIIPLVNQETKTINFYTYEYFYQSGSTLDWTYKLDYASEITKESPRIFQNKYTNLKYKKTEDLQNTNWKKWIGYLYKTEYSDKQFYFDNDFITSERNIELNLENSQLAQPWEPSLTQGNWLDTSGNNFFIYSRYCPKEWPGTENDGYPLLKVNLPTKQKVLFYAKRNIPNYAAVGNHLRRFTFGYTSYNYYPYAGHILYPDTNSEFNYDLNFITNAPMLISNSSITQNNLYNLFYKNMFSNIQNKDAEFITCNVYLNYVDIINLKMNDKIFIKDSYYLINSIEWNTEDNLCKVELIKILTNFNLNIETIDNGYIYSTIPITPISSPLPTRNFNNSFSTLRSTNSGATSNRNEGLNNIINGSNNIVYGNNVIIPEGINNVIIYDDYTIPRYSDATYQNGQITVCGVTMLYDNVCDGGFNEVQNPYGADIVNVKNGGYNCVREYNSARIKNVTDGGLN